VNEKSRYTVAAITPLTDSLNHQRKAAGFSCCRKQLCMQGAAVTSPDPSTAHPHPTQWFLMGHISMMPAWNGRKESKQPKASRL